MQVAGYISIATLVGIIWVIAEFRLIKYQHSKMWKDYEKRHGMNGYSKAVRAGD